MRICRLNMNVLQIVNEVTSASQQVQNTTDRLKFSTDVITEVRSRRHTNGKVSRQQYWHCRCAQWHKQRPQCVELHYRLRTVQGALLRHIDILYLVQSIQMPKRRTQKSGSGEMLGHVDR